MYPDKGQLQIDAQNGDVQLIFCEQGLNQACLELPVVWRRSDSHADFPKGPVLLRLTDYYIT